MQFEDAAELKDFLQQSGYAAELYEKYSGRSMYGRTTTGVTTDASPFEMKQMEEEMMEVEIDPAYKQDSMGLDFIYY